jgi:hypothetical protein
MCNVLTARPFSGHNVGMAKQGNGVKVAMIAVMLKHREKIVNVKRG